MTKAKVENRMTRLIRKYARLKFMTNLYRELWYVTYIGGMDVSDH